jgi:hypothetical protein
MIVSIVLIYFLQINNPIILLFSNQMSLDSFLLQKQNSTIAYGFFFVQLITSNSIVDTFTDIFVILVIV